MNVCVNKNQRAMVKYAFNLRSVGSSSLILLADLIGWGRFLPKIVKLLSRKEGGCRLKGYVFKPIESPSFLRRPLYSFLRISIVFKRSSLSLIVVAGMFVFDYKSRMIDLRCGSNGWGSVSRFSHGSTRLLVCFHGWKVLFRFPKFSA